MTPPPCSILLPLCPCIPSELLSCRSSSALLPSCSRQEAATNILRLLWLLLLPSATSMSALSLWQLLVQLFSSLPWQLGLAATHLCLRHLSGPPIRPHGSTSAAASGPLVSQGLPLPLTSPWLPQLLLLRSHQSDRPHRHFFLSAHH